MGGGIDKEISCINFSRNIWCGYCNQYENYILSVAITNGVCPLGAAHSLFINTPNQIYDFLLKSVINLMMATVGRNM